MQLRHIVGSSLLFAVAALSTPGFAGAEDAQGFVEREHQRLAKLLREPESPARQTELGKAISGFVDYDELTKRAFGEPCPASEASCENLWSGYSEAQRSELRGLLEELIRKNYERNLKKTLDYEVNYRGVKDAGDTTKVMTEAKNTLKPREPAVRVDYVVKQTAHGLKVVDMVTEGSSMAKAYYDQFRKKMHEPSEGYPNIVQKLKEKIGKD